MAGICSLNPTTLMTFKWGHRALKGFLLLGQREVSSLLFSLFNCVFCVFLGKMSGNKQNETN
ncbi:hypothetical protein NC651_029917 [Populus alba x Populus x berolinensis]|nr:hypothetical protein NC651_029917 [Populus alba x Populus x berolinensis]